MDNENNFSLEDFLNANLGKKLNTQDYLHALFSLNKLPIDLVFCLVKFCSPEFKVVNNFIFLSELFCQEKYENLIVDNEIRKAQLWLNLVEITGIFDEIKTEKAILLSQLIVESWNLKLKYEYSEANGRARVIHDKETNEVFITVD